MEKTEPEIIIAIWPNSNGYEIEIETDDYDFVKCETKAEAYLYAAKRFHELGMNELQERINKL